MSKKMCRTLEVGRQIVKQRRLQAGLQIVEYEQHGNKIEEHSCNSEVTSIE